MIRLTGPWVLVVLLVGGLAIPAAAGVIEDNLSAYTDDTAKGYLKPLQEALGQGLNTNFSTTAAIPDRGFYVKLDVLAMAVKFKGGDDTFEATTGGDFTPVQTVEVPTVVGPGESVTVDGDGGTQYVFPGGFDLGSLSFALPQLTVGSYKGTEGIVRWILIPTNDDDIEDVSFFGIGARHSISQYMTSDVDLVGDVYYQKLGTGGDLIDARTFSIGVATGKQFGVINSYARVSYDTISMDVKYTSEAGAESENVDLSMGSEGFFHVAASIALALGPVEANLGADFAKRLGVGAGIHVKFGRAP
jgi:hypothetical protein